MTRGQGKRQRAGINDQRVARMAQKETDDDGNWKNNRGKKTKR